MGHRCSALPIAQFCGAAPAMSAKGGASRAAAMGSAFHARCADPEGAEAKERWARLTPEEQRKVAQWIKPTELVLETGAVLRYEDAYKELALGLGPRGEYQPKGTPDNVTEGTCDICWVVEAQGMRIAYVPDIKRSEWTVSDGPDSLQILAYARAAAMRFGCDGYCAGIWAAEEGRWWWGKLFVFGLDDEEMAEHWARIKAAALHDSAELSYGTHCQGCYGRRSCPAWLLDPIMAETQLRHFTLPGMAIKNVDALTLLLTIKRAEETADLAKKLLQAHVRDGNDIVDEEKGKAWRPIKTSGRVTLDAERFEREHPELFKAYSKQGADYEVFRWVNAEPKKKGKKS